MSLKNVNKAGQIDHATEAKTIDMNYCRLDGQQLLNGIQLLYNLVPKPLKSNMFLHNFCKFFNM
uniref:Uncharacterized protein n=1 Tax=Romanomermis culicivorax TaxID=13658 RepID=A0A915IL77_ROMCU